MSEVSSFITSGFEGVISPMERVTHEVLDGWNLIILAAVLLLVVVNKQLYPRQFRQLLSVPGGVAHTNQLLREWTPTRSFIGLAFLFSYIVVVALFLQKASVIFSRDVDTYNGFGFFSAACGVMALWILLRYLTLAITGWLFQQQEVVSRQITVDLSVSTYGFLVLMLVLLPILYIPNSVFVWVGVGIVFAMALMRLFLSLMETKVFSKMPSFYIFLYFCSLEIVPLVLIFTAGMRFFAQSTVL